MNRKEAINSIIGVIKKEDLVISTTGLISRELFESYDSERMFYMTGSMGLASSIGLGVALSNPSRTVYVIEGDASLAMNLGNLITIGNSRPRNFAHIILDNGVCDSCSGEPSVSRHIDLGRFAYDARYPSACVVENDCQLRDALRDFDENGGPYFILTKILPGGRRDLGRPMNLPYITKRFRNFLISYQGL